MLGKCTFCVPNLLLTFVSALEEHYETFSLKALIIVFRG